MSNKFRHLIVSDDVRTWKFDRPTIFLGEWCRTYALKRTWEHMPAIVAAPYGTDPAQKDADYKRAREIEEILFPKLCNVLNNHHKVLHSERFWRILLGHWLQRYIDVMINRIKTLEQCFDSYQISGMTLPFNNCDVLASEDSLGAIRNFNDGIWNGALTRRIVDFLDGQNFEIENIVDGVKEPTNASVTLVRIKKKVVKVVNRCLGILNGYLSRDDGVLIIGSYLSKKEDAKLQVVFRQFPHYWRPVHHGITRTPDRMLRHFLASQMQNNSNDKLENIISSMAFELLPICYLEGLDELYVRAEYQAWPKRPKWIFTSNNFDTDEIFKLWTAMKVEGGSKYYVGQHGNNYGTHRYIKETIEEITSDKFLTWGWVDGLCQHTPAFALKKTARNVGRYNPLGGLLLIETCLNHRMTTWDGTAEFSTYFDDQIAFVSKLKAPVRSQLIIRLHSQFKTMNWGENARWRNYDSGIKLDIGSGAIQALIAKSRLIVHSYDSTCMLETLAQNIPTIAFWQNEFDHLRESSKPYYQQLVNAGIVCLSPDSAAKKVNEVWDNVDDWWNSGQIQAARKQFCYRYARQSKNPILELKEIFSG